MAQPFNTEFVYMHGKAKWAKTVQPNKFNKWSIDLYLDPESLEKARVMQTEGVKNVIKKDEDGWFITYSRPVSKETRDGRTLTFRSPEVLDKDGLPIPDTRIGNGSDVTVKLEVYSHGTPTGGKAKACRLLSVKVHELVSYTVENDFDEDQQRAVKDLADQPAPMW